MNISVTVSVKYRWFFWPCFSVCFFAVFLGASAERMADFLARHCITAVIK